jgi:endonuclease G, mitochondrial
MLTSPFARGCLLAAAFGAAVLGAGADKKSNSNAPIGLPGPAEADPAAREHYLIDRPEYILSYNSTAWGPNWVCWRLCESDLGKAAGCSSPTPSCPVSAPR